MNQLIGLTGRMGCGKSTVATHLMQEHGFTEYSFAQPLKEMVCMLLGLTESELEQKKRSDLPILPGRGEANFPTMRRVLQTLGTEWGRQNIHPELWLAIAEQRLHAMAEWQHLERIVISDVRFENEAAFIRSRGGVIVHIHRPLHMPASKHASERALWVDDADILITNDGTQGQLFQRVTDALHAHGLAGATP